MADNNRFLALRAANFVESPGLARETEMVVRNYAYWLTGGSPENNPSTKYPPPNWFASGGAGMIYDAGGRDVSYSDAMRSVPAGQFVRVSFRIFGFVELCDPDKPYETDPLQDQDDLNIRIYLNQAYFGLPFTHESQGVATINRMPDWMSEEPSGVWLIDRIVSMSLEAQSGELGFWVVYGQATSVHNHRWGGRSDLSAGTPIQQFGNTYCHRNVLRLNNIHEHGSENHRISIDRQMLQIQLLQGFRAEPSSRPYDIVEVIEPNQTPTPVVPPFPD